jgi:hypothetical protein
MLNACVTPGCYSPLSLTGSLDLEQTVREAVAGEAATQVEQPAMESVQVEEAMTIVEYPTMTVVGAFAALDTALVLASTSTHLLPLLVDLQMTSI